MPVVIVAAEHGGRRSCSTSTAMYAALDPPTLVVSLAEHSTTRDLALRAGRFSVSALSTDQVEHARSAGARSGDADKFAALGIPVAEPSEDFTVPSVAGAEMAWACRVVAVLPAGDHSLVVAEIEACRGPNGDGVAQRPLLRHSRTYRGIGDPTDLQDRGGYPL